MEVFEIRQRGGGMNGLYGRDFAVFRGDGRRISEAWHTDKLEAFRDVIRVGGHRAVVSDGTLARSVPQWSWPIADALRA
jgi:hypothetical protein